MIRKASPFRAVYNKNPMDQELAPVRSLLLKEGEASLATLEGEVPFASAVNFFFKAGSGEALGEVYLFLSQIARHAKNLGENPNVSLLVVEAASKTPLPERKRVTLIGRAEAVTSDSEKKTVEPFYRRKFPFAEILFTLPDFQFYRVRTSAAHWIGGFGQIKNFQLTG